MVRTIIWELELDMMGWLIRLNLSEPPSNPIRAKMKCSKSCDNFSCHVTDCSVTRIPSLSITGCCQQVCGCIGVGFLKLCTSVVGIFHNHSQQGSIDCLNSVLTYFNCISVKKTKQKNFTFQMTKVRLEFNFGGYMCLIRNVKSDTSTFHVWP